MIKSIEQAATISLCCVLIVTAVVPTMFYLHLLQRYSEAICKVESQRTELTWLKTKYEQAKTIRRSQEAYINALEKYLLFSCGD